MPVPAPDLKSFTPSDGARLAWEHWLPHGPPHARVVALHGIQSHAGWYHGTSAALCSAGCEVLFLDRRGSGRNAAERGHAPHADRLVADVIQFLLEHGQPGSDVPLLLLGVSWGGKLAAVVAARRPRLLDGLILLYPGLCPRIRIRADQRLRLLLAERLGLGRRRVDVPLSDPALFTDAPAAQEWIRRDPRALHQATVGFLKASSDLDRTVDALPARLTLPTFVQLAGRDRIIDVPATRRWFDRLAAHDKQLVVYPAARHTLEFEPNAADIRTDLVRWIEVRTWARSTNRRAA